jgi:WD40 repeat protein
MQALVSIRTKLMIDPVPQVHPYTKIALGVLSFAAKVFFLFPLSIPHCYSAIISFVQIILAQVDRDAAIVTSSWDTTVRLWDAVTGIPVGLSLRRHTHSVLSVSFSPDGTRIITGSSFKGDTTVALSNSPCPISVSFIASCFYRVLNYPHLPVISTVV